MARCTRRRITSLARPPLTTRETVLIATSASSATARMVGLAGASSQVVRAAAPPFGADSVRARREPADIATKLARRPLHGSEKTPAERQDRSTAATRAMLEGASEPFQTRS